MIVLASEKLTEKKYLQIKSYLDSVHEMVQSELITYEGTVWNGFEKGMSLVETPFLMMVREGDIYKKDSLKKALKYFETVQEETDAVAMRSFFLSSRSVPEKLSRKNDKNIYDLSEQSDISRMPMTYTALVFSTESVKNEKFDMRHGTEIWEEFVYRILDKKRKLGYVSTAIFVVNEPEKKNNVRNIYNTDKGWYLDTLKGHSLLMIEYYLKKYGEIPIFIQNRLLYNMKLRFIVNKSRNNKQILDEDEAKEFFELCRQVLQYIDDVLLISSRTFNDKLGLNYALQCMFLNTKYDSQAEIKYFLDAASEEERLHLPVLKNQAYQSDVVRIQINGRKLPNFIVPKLTLDVANCDKKYLVLEFSAPDYLKRAELNFSVKFNNKCVELEETVRYAEVSYLGQKPIKRYTFRIRIPFKYMEKKNSLICCLEQEGHKLILPIKSGRYPARISSKYPYSYWCFGDYMMHFNRTKKSKCEIIIEKKTFLRHFGKESLFLINMLRPKYRARKAFLTRMLYWIMYPSYHKKNIWLTYDKLYKGGDCGEYFYKYMVSRKDSDVFPVYVINADAPDRKRLEKEGYEPLIYNSLKHRLIYLHSKMIFATHAGVYNYNAITAKELMFFQDLLNADATCIQHGLTVQYLAFNANRTYNNNKRYYCASKYEVNNLLNPDYGYDDPSVIRLTGIPRYDGLINNDQKQILITPTWRSYIALPQFDKNNTRPYSPDFKNTDYFKIYNELISDKRLVETARKTGYKLIYLIHPAVCQQRQDYTVHEGVEIVSALETDYEKILTESSLMVTDYSGVQFDFAYMRKPIVYYHPKELPPHYQEGGFFYDTQGFGEICERHEEIINYLCEYMENGCKLKPFYREREDDFFAYSDLNSCQRIFDDALEFQKEQYG